MITEADSYELLFVTTEVSFSHPVSPDRQSSLQYHLETTRFIIQRIIIVVVVIVGVVGNVFNIAVLTRRWMKSSTNHYLTALAVYDSLYLILSLTMSLSHYALITNSPWYNHYRMPFGRPLTDVCSNTGVWLTLTFTVERYIGVCFPMKGKVWCTTRRARYIILLVCFVAFLVTLPEFFEMEMVEKTDALNRTALSVSRTAFGSQASYLLGYYYANQILFTFLPLLLLLLFNSLLIRAVMYAARQRKTMTKASDVITTSAMTSKMERHHRDQQRITVMLISVVIVFLVCQLPQAVQKLYNEYLHSYKRMNDKNATVLKITANYFNLLVMINCSINFVLYSSFSTKFRMTFRRLFCRPRTPELILTTDMMTGNQTQMEEFSSAGFRNNDSSTNFRGSAASIASFSVTNPQQCRSRSRSPVRSSAQVSSRCEYKKLCKNRLSPSGMEMKTYVIR